MSNRFISETELQERRHKRQEEWEKVRRPDQPQEAPEEEYDPRSLYERLQEHKDRKQQEYEEAHKLKNMVKGLDDDEVDFLDLVDHSKIAAEKKRSQDDAQVLAEYRKKVMALQEQEAEERVKVEVRKTKAKKRDSGDPFLGGKKTSQMQLLAGVVKRKRTEGAVAASNKRAQPIQEGNPLQSGGEKTTVNMSSSAAEDCSDARSEGTAIGQGMCSSEAGCRGQQDMPQVDMPLKVAVAEGSLKCVAVLPGMGEYPDSSDSEATTESEEDSCGHTHYDLVGRKVRHVVPGGKL